MLMADGSNEDIFLLVDEALIMINYVYRLAGVNCGN